MIMDIPKELSNIAKEGTGKMRCGF